MSIKNSQTPDQKKQPSRKGCCIGCLLPLLYLIVLNLLPFLYMPPALTAEKKEVYLRVVTYITSIKEKHDLENAMLTQHDRLEIYRNNKWIDESKVLSEDEIEQGLRLCAELKKVHCRHAVSEGDMILFYPMVSWFLPHPPGVLHSISGESPDQATQPRVTNVRPFEKLEKNWYSSMAMRPRRFSGW